MFSQIYIQFVKIFNFKQWNLLKVFTSTHIDGSSEKQSRNFYIRSLNVVFKHYWLTTSLWKKFYFFTKPPIPTDNSCQVQTISFFISSLKRVHAILFFIHPHKKGIISELRRRDGVAKKCSWKWRKLRAVFLPLPPCVSLLFLDLRTSAEGHTKVST